MPRIRLLLLAMTLFSFGQVASAHSVTETPANGSATTVVVPDHAVRARTLSLIDARARLEAATPGDRGQRLAEVVSVAKQRRLDLTALVDTNPREFLRVSLPAEIRARLPAEASTFVEQEADETGELEVLHVDYPDPANNYYVHYLHTAKGKFSLHFADSAPTLATGHRVRARGVKLDNAIVLAAGGVTQPVQGLTALSGTLGAQKTLTILVNFSDAPSQPFTVAYAQNVMLNTTNSFDYEASYQQTTLTGDVAGWFTIAETSAGCNYSNISSQAQQKAAAAGFALANYSRFVYVFPANGCGWWGLGTVGGRPSHAWVHARYGFSLSVVGHEMGHNLGLYHSHSLDCGDAAVAASGCAASEYGDAFDLMGSSNTTPHYNAFQKERLGWLNAGISPPLTTVAAIPGTSNYTIAPIEDARNATPRALKIPRSTACGVSTEWFYVESRQAKGFDAFLSGNLNLQTGVLVHKVTEGDADSSFLLDMTPATASWSDPALVAGQTFTDPLTGIVITPLSVGSSSSTVAVTFPPAACTRAAPTVSLTPSGTVYASAGGSATYAVSVSEQRQLRLRCVDLRSARRGSLGLGCDIGADGIHRARRHRRRECDRYHGIGGARRVLYHSCRRDELVRVCECRHGRRDHRRHCSSPSTSAAPSHVCRQRDHRQGCLCASRAGQDRQRRHHREGSERREGRQRCGSERSGDCSGRLRHDAQRNFERQGQRQGDLCAEVAGRRGHVPGGQHGDVRRYEQFGDDELRRAVAGLLERPAPGAYSPAKAGVYAWNVIMPAAQRACGERRR